MQAKKVYGTRGSYSGLKDKGWGMKKTEVLKEQIKQLSIENKDLLNIFNHMPDTYYRADLNGVTLKVSPSAESLMACKTNDLLGKKLGDFYVDPNGRENVPLVGEA